MLLIIKVLVPFSYYSAIIKTGRSTNRLRENLVAQPLLAVRSMDWALPRSSLGRFARRARQSRFQQVELGAPIVIARNFVIAAQHIRSENPSSRDSADHVREMGLQKRVTPGVEKNRAR
jgi:hypothetical protein